MIRAITFLLTTLVAEAALHPKTTTAWRITNHISVKGSPTRNTFSFWKTYLNTHSQSEDLSSNIHKFAGAQISTVDE